MDPLWIYLFLTSLFSELCVRLVKLVKDFLSAAKRWMDGRSHDFEVNRPTMQMKKTSQNQFVLNGSMVPSAKKSAQLVLHNELLLALNSAFSNKVGLAGKESLKKSSEILVFFSRSDLCSKEVMVKLKERVILLKTKKREKKKETLSDEILISINKKSACSNEVMAFPKKKETFSNEVLVSVNKKSAKWNCVFSKEESNMLK